MFFFVFVSLLYHCDGETETRLSLIPVNQVVTVVLQVGWLVLRLIRCLAIDSEYNEFENCMITADWRNCITLLIDVKWQNYVYRCILMYIYQSRIIDLPVAHRWLPPMPTNPAQPSSVSLYHSHRLFTLFMVLFYCVHDVISRSSPWQQAIIIIIFFLVASDYSVKNVYVYWLHSVVVSTLCKNYFT